MSKVLFALLGVVVLGTNAFASGFGSQRQPGNHALRKPGVTYQFDVNSKQAANYFSGLICAAEFFSRIKPWRDRNHKLKIAKMSQESLRNEIAGLKKTAASIIQSLDGNKRATVRWVAWKQQFASWSGEQREAFDALVWRRAQRDCAARIKKLVPLAADGSADYSAFSQVMYEFHSEYADQL